MTTNTKIDDGLIDTITLYKECAWYLRYDVLPFLFIYVNSLALILSDQILVKQAGLVLFPIGLSVHLLLFLAAQSSVSIRCLLGKKKVSSVYDSTYVMIKAAKNSGKDRIVKLMMDSEVANSSTVSVLTKSYNISKVTFSFQEVTYFYNESLNRFERLNYPIDVSVKDCLSWQGYPTEEAFVAGIKRWGINEFNIPMPHFLDLYAEHLVAPFFVFQVLCLFLWSLDDYWYYSVFTLMMLMVFEGVMCTQRQNSVLMMRNMRRPAFRLFVYRNNEWLLANSATVVPGDIISVTSDTSLNNLNIQDGQLKFNRNASVEDEKVLPCDILLIRGNCVVNEAMLTGESVPKMKESITLDDEELLSQANTQQSVTDVTKLPGWNRHILLGGTLLQQHSNVPTADAEQTNIIPDAPDRGCLGIALRTGFATTQGELMRKILFATEGAVGNTRETFAFIAVLVLFAIVAAVVVLQEGLQDSQRNKFRLALHCIMIITSVVPPELPMELSLAVTNSLGALAKQMIYCTEPFRIEYAGRLNVVCFDKTGTLTKDEMILKGVVGGQDVELLSGVLIPDDNPNELSTVMITPETSTDLVQCIMGSCHELIQRNVSFVAENKAKNVIGDPLELAAFAASGFEFVPVFDPTRRQMNMSASNNRVSNAQLQLEIQVIHRYPFSSDVKRMSMIAMVRGTPDNPSQIKTPMTYVFTKGAPEVIQAYLKTVPSNYTAVYQKYMRTGKRVLTLAYKVLTEKNIANLARYPRQKAEQDLHFAGFLMFDCDLKPDTRSVIKDLLYARHKVVMITGDSVFTAANVGTKLSLADSTKPTSVLTIVQDKIIANMKNSKNKKEEDGEKGSSKLVWRKIDSDQPESLEIQPGDVPFDLAQVHSLSTQAVLCVTGSALSHLWQTVQQSPPGPSYGHILKELCPAVTIFARVSPLQKESILLAYNDAGCYTLMCGDGTNDVGALKAAHVGVSVINNPQLESKVERAVAANKEKGSGGKDRLQRALLELQEHEADPTVVKLGDASIASPFTAKRTSIDSILSVIRQGRCTLVTTIQVYKVLALNCLASAFMMSALYMKGLKHGDTQMTCSGIIIAGLFFFLSQAKPLPHIAPDRPPSSVFASSVSLSIAGQFLVHLCSMYATMLLCDQFANPDSTQSPDGKFSPNLLNSAMFILSNQMQINNFWVNYRGAPFMEPLSSNVYFWRALQGVYLSILIVVGGQFEPLNDLLQLVQFPNQQFQIQFLGILIANAGVAYLIEQGCRRLE